MIWVAGGTTSTVEETARKVQEVLRQMRRSKATTVEFPAYKKGVATPWADLLRPQGETIKAAA